MITVVVPAYNSAKTLGGCLDALLAQTAPPGSYEIIVVDDGSTDGTAEVAQAKGVCVVRQPNGGAGAARNTGASRGTGELVVFVDADSVPDARFLEMIAVPFGRPEIVGASGEKKTRQSKLWARLVQTEYDYKYDLIAAHPSIDFVDSSTAAYRRDVFLSNGGFDTTMQEAEDTELSFRLSARGYKLVLVRDAVAYHTHPESLREFLVRKYHYAIWRSVVYARMPNKMAAETRTPRAQKIQVMLAAAMAPLVVASLLWPPLGWLAAALLALFMATTVGFVAYAWKRDRAVAWVSPFVLLLEAYAGGLGLLVGLIRWRKRSSSKRSFANE